MCISHSFTPRVLLITVSFYVRRLNGVYIRDVGLLIALTHDEDIISAESNGRGTKCRTE